MQQFLPKSVSLLFLTLLVFGLVCQPDDSRAQGERIQQDDDKTMRVFIFAGQSNMVGSDSNVADIEQYPPFAGLESSQESVQFAYCIGRENKTKSDGWVDLQPVNGIVGPELSFANKVMQHSKAPIAIIKVAAGGTHLGGDWNPDEPTGFELYPLALDFVKKSLADLKSQGVEYRLEGFMWHQGENDMFEESYMENYGKNLKNFMACWRRDLDSPNLEFYVGELCCKTIWGMDLRPRMYKISLGQRDATETDPNAQYVPTSHVGVEIGRGVGLHYHYGTLGQLEHGVNYADAYLKSLGIEKPVRTLKKWPYEEGSRVKLFVMAGHRNMEGERAFVQELTQSEEHKSLLNDDTSIAFRYSLGGGYHQSNEWEPLGPTNYYDTFGPELSFGKALKANMDDNIAIAKFTHSGSQILDWTPEGSEAKSRNLYPDFLVFIKQSIASLEKHGHTVELTGIYYHVGENDMSFGPHRKNSANRLGNIIEQIRVDLERPNLKWFVSQQPPTDDESVNKLDVVADFEQLVEKDSNLIHLKTFDLSGQEKKLVISTFGIVELGEILARAYLEQN